MPIGSAISNAAHGNADGAPGDGSPASRKLAAGFWNILNPFEATRTAAAEAAALGGALRSEEHKR